MYNMSYELSNIGFFDVGINDYCNGYIALYSVIYSSCLSENACKKINAY